MKDIKHNIQSFSVVLYTFMVWSKGFEALLINSARKVLFLAAFACHSVCKHHNSKRLKLILKELCLMCRVGLF